MMDDTPKQYPESPGALRTSQIITMCGPGAIVQTEYDSILIMGIDTWSKHKAHYEILHHPYLEQLLNKKYFKMPRQIGKQQVISCRSFPQWGVCSNPRCSMLQRHNSAPPRGEKQFNCKSCHHELYAAKFVAICSNGHIEEFPWEEWAHSKTSENRPCKKNPCLKFSALGKSPGLADYYVTCQDCKARRSCAGITSVSALKDIVPRCSGSVPWIGTNVTERCDDINGGTRQMRGIQIRSTSMYYPVTVSALYLPKWLHPIQKKITANNEQITGALDMGTIREVAEKYSGFKEEREKYGVDEIEKHLDKELSNQVNTDEKPTQSIIRNSEYDDLINSEFDDHDYLEISDTAIIVDKDLAGYVNKLKQIKRLTEIQVMWAFTREAPVDPYLQGDKDAEYYQISNKNTEWYPAVENRGEGFLFTLDEQRLQRWEAELLVKSRCKQVQNAFEELFSKLSTDDPRRPPRYMLLHTLAHVLIREVAAVSGYNEASIRERIYSGNGYNGILLYTATSSSDGSLGGLVRQGSAKNFANLIKKSIQKSMRCSRDPFCAEDPVESSQANTVPLYSRVNASACYGCVLLPETSCENVNRLLDRRLLFDSEFGYFREWGQH